ncbi:MAG: hypothetical protein H0X66_17280 [Verrucomicrobia bacterium]|nr:hypothetical protein [Verrucomicrobiota bacterium]
MKTQSFGFAALLFAGALVLGFCNNTKAQSYELSPVWSIPAETPGYDWIFTNSTQRGLAYNAATGNLLTTSRYPATNAAVYIHASSDGTHLGNLSTVNVFADINFPLNMIAVADDGVIYACNLTIDSAHADIIGNTGPFRLYRWANESAEPTVAYVGDPSDEDEILNHRRFGDSLSVRGSGVDTEILVGTRAGRIVIRFTTADGTNFAPQKISAPDLTAVNNTMTIAFGSGNTFWIKSQINATLRPLQHFSFDPVTTNAILIQNYTNAVFVGGPLGFDAARNLLGLIDTIGHELRLFKVTESGLIQQGTTHSLGINRNGNSTGAVAFSNNRVFVLDTDNGITAFNLTSTPLVPFSTSVSAQTGEVTVSWQSQAGIAYQVQYKDDLAQSSWMNFGEATNGTGATISISDPVGIGAKFYQIRAE